MACDPRAEDERAEQLWRRRRTITRIVAPIVYGAIAGVAAAFGVAILFDDVATLPAMSSSLHSAAIAELASIGLTVEDRPRQPAMTIIYLDDVIIPRTFDGPAPLANSK